MNQWLLDTGPIIAFLDSRDPQHDRVAAALDSFSGRLVTSSAVVLEAMHLLTTFRAGAVSLVEFLVASKTEIYSCTSIEELLESAKLMAKYSDTPLDFADATLILLACRKKIYKILTLDRRGFRTYRAGRKAFQLVMDDYS